MAKAKQSVQMGQEVTPPKSRAKEGTATSKPAVKVTANVSSTAAKPKSAAPAEPAFVLPTRRSRWLTVGLPTLVIVTAALIGGFLWLYNGKIYPGVAVDGTYLGGLSRSAATTALASATTAYQAQAIPVTYGNATISLGVAQIGTRYDVDQSIAQAYAHGRQGSLPGRLRQILRALINRPTKLSDVSFNDALLTPYLNQVGEAVTTPVVNAGLQFSGSSASVVAAKTGQRLDTGLLVRQIQQRLASASSGTVAAPVYRLQPVVDSQGLAAAKSQADGYLAGPLTLKLPSKTVAVNPSDITGWITVTRAASDADTRANLQLGDLAGVRAPTPISLSLSDSAIAGYVANLAGTVDQVGQNAALTITGGVATVFQPSRAGYTLDQAGTVSAIKTALGKPPADRTVAVSVKTTQPAVTEANLNSLGINELISEGVTYFPGSPGVRIQNIRAGASKFNGVLIAPNQTFSFESLLGDVDAATGYAPAIVIVGNKEEYQYGGGLCQVSTTAYRAALLAGLPIVERHNHSYAVSYYTAPYGVPGVDATIYDASIDFKFLNDTGHYILIQTILSGSTLKFDFYGTKVESGRIRGPYFVDPANGAGWNPTVPSTTVFYRDVLDLNGNVTKTDTVTTHYASSNDFPLVPQFN